jgi:hypothetical protein
MIELMWFRVLARMSGEPIPRERQREFERELENHIGFGGLKPIIRRFVRW